MKKFLESNWLKLLLSGVLLIVVYKSVDNLSNIFSFLQQLLSVARPCIIGAVIALFVYIPIKKVEGVLGKVKLNFVKKHAKAFGIFAVYLALFLLIGVAIKYIVPVLYKNIEDLVAKIPQYLEQLNKLTEHLTFLPEVDLGFIGEQLLKYFNLERLNEYLTVITGIANSFISFLVSIIISVYIILEKDQMALFVSKLGKRLHTGKKTEIVMMYIKDIVALFRSYFAGLLMDSLLIGVICTFVFVMFKVPYAVFLGLVIAVGNMIPFFGPIIAAVVAYLIAMISLGPINAIWVLVFQLVMGQIDGNIIQPRIVGSQVGVSPLMVLVSVTIFGGLFGPLGMILGVPVCASAKLVIEDYLDDGKIDRSTDNTEKQDFRK